MGWDYALVHVKYTIPPALLLTLLYRPLCTRLDAYKVLFLITIAVTATIPWDSYLIRNRVWSYPADAVLGPTIYHIPLEELFFFIIQTYDVCLLYLCITKPTFHPAILPHGIVTEAESWPVLRRVVVTASDIISKIILIGGIAKGAHLIYQGGEGSYLGLIVVWAFPFLLLLQSLTHQIFVRLPISNTIIPIIIPTIYLWLVDTFSLQRGTWVIESATKTGLYLWNGLEIEEALFFLVTNMLIVCGLVAFDNAVAIIDTFPHLFPDATSLPSPLQAFRALLIPTKMYDGSRVVGLDQAIRRLKKKSRSFYLASSTFERRLRIDLVLLYSFSRAADDLIDGARSAKEAQKWITRLKKFLDLSYRESKKKTLPEDDVKIFVDTNFPSDVRLALLQLPIHQLSKEPLYDLLKGFEMDLRFCEPSEIDGPIKSTADLDKYGEYVAGTIAKLCLDLVFFHYPGSTSRERQSKIKERGNEMGISLQIINIARDIQVDADMGRVYIPLSWLKDAGLSPDDVLKDSATPQLEEERAKLLQRALGYYNKAKSAIDELPVEARGPMRVAIESYVEIGRTLQQKNYKIKVGRATVPKSKRLWVAWNALNR